MSFVSLVVCFLQEEVFRFFFLAFAEERKYLQTTPHASTHTQKKLISVMETSSCKAPAMMMRRSISQTTTRGGGGGGRARSADFANPARRQNDIDDDDLSTNNTNKRKSVRARSSRRNVGDNANIVYSLGPEKTSKEPTKMLNRQQWPNECTEIICEDGSSVYCFSYGGGKGVGRANAQSSKATAKGGDFVVQSSSSEEDLNARLNAITMSFREQRKKTTSFSSSSATKENITETMINAAIQASAKRSQEYCDAYAEEAMKKLREEEEKGPSAAVAKNEPEKEGDMQGRLDAIIREHRKKQEEVLKSTASASSLTEVTREEKDEEGDLYARLNAIAEEFRAKRGEASKPNLSIQGKNGGMSGMASFYSAPGYAGFSWVGEEDVEMEDDHDHDHDHDNDHDNHGEETRGDHSGRVGKTSFYSSAGYASFAYAVDAVWDVLVVPPTSSSSSSSSSPNVTSKEWGQKIGENNTIVSTSGIAYKSKPVTQSSSSIIAESVSREQTAQIKKAWKRVDARFDLPGPPNMWTRMDNEEKFLAIALSVATCIICYQNAPPVVRKPVQAATSSVKKLAHISRSTQPPAMPMTKKEKKAAQKAAAAKKKAKVASINQSIGELSRAKKRAASMIPGDDVAPGQFLAIIRGDGTIDYTLRNVFFLVTFSFLARIIMKQYDLKPFGAISGAARAIGSTANALVNTGFKDEEKFAADKEAIRIAAEIKAKKAAERKAEKESKRLLSRQKDLDDAKISAIVDSKLQTIRRENDVLLNKVSKFFENEEIEMVAQLMKENDAKIEAVVAQVKYAKAERNAFKRLMENEMYKASSAVANSTISAKSASAPSLPSFSGQKDANSDNMEVKQFYENKIEEIKKDAEIAKHSFAFFKKEYIAKEDAMKKDFVEKEKQTALEVKQKIDALSQQLKESQEEFERARKDAEIALKLALENEDSERLEQLEKDLKASKEALAKERDTNGVAAQKREEEVLARNKLELDAKLAALEEDFKQREAAMKLKVDAAEAKAKEFERKNFQTVSEMKLQSNKDVNDALSSARASFAKEKEELLRKVEEERLQSRLEVQREKEAIRQKSDELIDEIALEFRREIETRSSR